ncbi:DUF488 domain-containing protein [Gluconacetobacter tumulisoli]|uniref:DUF488 domain-containing protein n=2 Tax=Gluconacetobacter tumulisoli TaxID=1286189 RepID=A0A7W4K862_9PROT|nr:DUF488 domain-containing protein [Gluconacetobacter tumulisoli]MBB2202096.1 DUF488 domain-containing protein [Gluconacetobacter tumulisoli]
MDSFFTIGHSTRTLDAFVGLLRQAGVARVVDVRSIPRSRTAPQFNKETLPQELALRQVGYDHLPALGGRRGRSRTIADSVNAFWKVRGFRNYADYALTRPFAEGLAHMLDLGQRHRCAIMCAKAVWWRCHRRIIADHLIASGRAVFHILGPGHVDAAKLTPGAVIRADRTVVYPGSAAIRSASSG